MAVGTTHSWWSGSPCNLERYQPSRSIDTTRIVARPVDTDRGTTRRWLDRAIATWRLLIGPWCLAWIQNWPFLTVRAPKISKKQIKFRPSSTYKYPHRSSSFYTHINSLSLSSHTICLLRVHRQEVPVLMMEAKIQPTRGSTAYSYHHGMSVQPIHVVVL
jgi:hypothetical protein